MTKKKIYRPIGTSGAKYGWAGITPAEFTERMKLASARFLKLKKEIDIDALAFCGSSGCAIAFSLATTHHIPLIYVRKLNESSHSNYTVECNDSTINIKKYLIVDDFVDTGGTVNHIVKSIRKYARNVGAYPAKPVGVLCFDPYVDRDRTMQTSTVSLKLFTVDTAQSLLTESSQSKHVLTNCKW